MSAIIHPRGPLPESVYWRRRLTLIVLVLAVVAGVSFLISLMGGTPTAVPTGKPTGDATAQGDVACDPADITLTAKVDHETFAEGELPKISMTITNGGAASCTINAGTDQQKYVITSGSDTIWDSTVCQTGAAPYNVTIAAGQSMTTDPLEWGRARSDNCDAGTAAVGGGASYQLSVYLGSIESAQPATFMLY